MAVSMVARCVRGLEWVAADEIADLPGLEFSRIGPRSVEFVTRELIDEVWGLRTVDDVFVEVGRVDDVRHTKDVPALLAERVAFFDFERVLNLIGAMRPVDGTAFDVVVSFDGGRARRRNFSRFDVEDAIGTALTPVLGRSYVSRRDNDSPPATTLTVRIIITDEEAFAGVRLDERPLHRRDYKETAGKGSLHPPMGAMLARLARCGRDSRVADPFCGDGTVAIELAQLGADVLATDLDAYRLATARRNAERADTTIQFEIADAAAPLWRDASLDAVVTNPPWNVSVHAGGAAADSFAPVWAEVRRGLTETGILAVIVDADLHIARSVPGHLFHCHLVQKVRLAGRLAEVAVFSPSDVSPLPERLRAWRDHAIEIGLITHEGEFS